MVSGQHAEAIRRAGAVQAEKYVSIFVQLLHARTENSAQVQEGSQEETAEEGVQEPAEDSALCVRQGQSGQGMYSSYISGLVD